MRLRTVIDDYLVINRKTPSDLSRELGWPPSSATRWLNGQSQLPGDRLAQLIAWLLSSEEVAEPEEQEEQLDMGGFVPETGGLPVPGEEPTW